ncbi:MAG TPA: MnmC family methyltransferase [Allosphingosinicella sp.]|jgi:spermidine synthase
MIPRVLIDSAPIPGGGGELRLIRRGDDFWIMLGSNALMSTRLRGSEEALGTLACERLAGRPRPAILIGGLGMGFTLRAALGALGRDSKVVVSELVPAIVKWARGPMAHVHAGSLDDPRVEVAMGDVGDLIAEARSSFDAVLLDVDNGPDALSRDSNDRLYDLDGLHRARAALKPGGLLAIWSAADDPAFSRRLAKAGFRVEEVTVRAHAGRKGAKHMIWLASRSR